MPTAPVAPVLIEVDPRDLIVDGNVRSNLGDLSALVESVKLLGVVVPVMVRPNGDGRYHLMAGGRRTAAAIEAGCKMPAIVREVDGAQAALEIGVLENLAREGLPAGDEARAFEQLAAFGLEVGMIAALTTRTPEHVEKGLAIARSAAATRVADRYDLTLGQAAAIAEFDKDREAVKVLTAAAKANPGEFDHVVAKLRLTRDRRDKATALRAALKKDKTTVVKDRPGYRLEGPCRLDELRDQADKPLTAKSHAKCPGHAAYVEESVHQDPSVVLLCADPKKHGHKARWRDDQPVRVGEKSPGDREQEATERREVRAGNVDWRAAETVRLEFVRNLLARKTPPKGTLRFVALEVTGDPDGIGRHGSEKVLVDLLGRAGEKAKLRTGLPAGGEYAHGRRVLLPETVAAPDARLPLLLLAQIAADREGSMGVHTWRDRPSGKPSPARRWLDFLVSCGYVQADIEKRVT